MRQSDDFSIFTISGVPYLLPFGQGIADLKRGVQINDTGKYLWELLGRERTEEEMLSLYAAHCEVPDSQLPQLKGDLQQFLHMLDQYGMLRHCEVPAASDDSSDLESSDVYTAGNTAEAESAAECRNIVRRYLSIGNLLVLLRGPDEAFMPDFNAFEISLQAPGARTDDGTMDAPLPDQTVTVVSHAPTERLKGRTLLKNPELEIREDELQYIFLFPNAPGIYEARLTKDGTDARYYCCPPYTELLQQDLFHAIRLSFLYLAQLHNMVVLHSASLLYRGRAWLFSGHSGAGKSTHTNLWKELFDVPLINGDLNLLSMENGRPMVHGLPWCGTSGIVDTHSYPLGGIILIKKALQNRTAALNDSHAQLFVAQRLISPNWTEALLQKNLQLVAGLAPHILICRLYCTKTSDAAETMRQAIDDYLALHPAEENRP